MDTRNCAKCGKWFSTYKNIPICPACEKKEEELFVQVKNYIEENPLSTTLQISEATGVSTKKILKYIREGRLEATKGIQAEVVCDVCGKPLSKGRFCDSCRIKLDQEVKEIFSPSARGNEPKEGDSKNKFYTASSSVKFRKKL